MLRRPIAYLAVTLPAAWSVKTANRQMHEPGNAQQMPYVPLGNSVPKVPWIRQSKFAPATSGATIATPTATKVPPTTALSTSQMDAVLDMDTDVPDTIIPAHRPVAGSAKSPTNSSGHGGQTRATTTRRVPGVTGPTLDSRISDIIMVDGSLAGEMLPTVVQLLIDPEAEGIENVSLSDFAAMQPKRQLAALNGKRSWHDWLLDSTHYKQVARLSLESPHYDLKALSLAGITTLYQWAEQPNLVKVSSYTRNLLDAAVDKSVEAYVDEVARLVNASNMLESTLAAWAADIIGKFVLDSLGITMEQAASARRDAGISSQMMKSGAADVNSGMSLTEQATIAAMESESPILRAGYLCTLDHYHRLAKKVLATVRREYMVQRPINSLANNSSRAALDSQAEAEIREKAYATLSDAMLRVLYAQAPRMPKELHTLRDNGFIALDRLHGLLRQITSVLQLQNVPVRYFVFHSIDGRSPSELEGRDANALSMGAAPTEAPGGGSAPHNSSGASGTGMGMSSAMSMAPPTLVSGMFLTGTANYNVTLGEWCGSPQPPVPHDLCRANPVQNEYFSVLHRLKRHTMRVSRTTLFEAIMGANQHRSGFNAAEALGLQQLFGTGKLVEDRLSSVLNGYYASPQSSRLLHFIEAGHSCGKTSVLERLSMRMTENGKKAVIVRYSGAATPFTPGLDDNPLAFPARFWFRVALASCPYLVRTEELFTRAPKSVMWWANRRNWSWELYQKCICVPGHSDESPLPLHAILVDDMDRVLDSMQSQLAHECSSATAGGVATDCTLGPQAHSTVMEAGGAEAKELGTQPENRDNSQPKSDAVLGKGKATEVGVAQANVEAASLHRRRTPTYSELVEAALAKVTVALGQLNMVFTGHHASNIFLTHGDTPIRYYFISLTSGIGLQQRLRVLPLVSVLHALHQRSRLEFSGLMYEVLKNCPGLLGYTLDVFWSGRAALMDLRGGAPHLMQWSGTHPLLRSYVPSELFAELPHRNHLLKNPPEARRRLVELLQRQLSSPTGLLTRGVDTTLRDERDGLTVSYNHTTCQVHPFALFTIFTHQDPLETPREGMIVRAWGEVWAEYCAVVSSMGTTSERKRDALRVLLHGALLLRVVAVSGAQVDLNLKIPPYGFPLLASPTRCKQRGSGGDLETVIVKATPETIRKAVAGYKTFFANTEQKHVPFRPTVGLNGGCDVVSVDGATLALYDLVTTNEALQDISYRFAEALLGVLHCLEMRVLPENRVRKVHYVSVVSIDQTSIWGASGSSDGVHGTSVSTRGAVASLTADDVFSTPPTPVVPYFLDLGAVFEDSVMDRLRTLQEMLGITKEFRTLNDLLDELEGTHNVRVHQDVIASQAELESLLSSTLMQLVPDATVLPPYAAEAVAPESLLFNVLREDDDDELRMPEVEEMRRESVLATEMPVCDSFDETTHTQESAELLEAMLNDSPVDSLPEPVGERMAERPAPVLPQMSAPVDMSVGNTVPASAPMGPSTTSPPANAAQEDALAWLHDLITPAAVSAPSTNPAGETSFRTTFSGEMSRPQVGTGSFVSLSNDEDVDQGAGEDEEGSFLEDKMFDEEDEKESVEILEEEEEHVVDERAKKSSDNDSGRQKPKKQAAKASSQSGGGKKGAHSSASKKKSHQTSAASTSHASDTPRGKRAQGRGAKADKRTTAATVASEAAKTKKAAKKKK
uniref:Uncharacterized protein n=1 Tax=Trypanosoma vivax (strain Y486) TaxID=1055687 RepID=G0U0Z9_TRYVY|nr:conserved hypothetical protein, fragment [Trypanosoma vivax Y486]